VQVDDLARGHEARAQPVPDLRQQLGDRLVELDELLSRDDAIAPQPAPLRRRCLESSTELTVDTFDQLGQL
jgi:hypothetical protein